MLRLENTEVIGWEHAIRGARNPMNSWDKMDSIVNDWVEVDVTDEEGVPRKDTVRIHSLDIGPNDLDLMKRLCKAGTDHRKFMRMIAVYVDITAPLYWWKEFDTYKVGTVANSCSTMHKIHAKEFTLEDFSHDQLTTTWAFETLEDIIISLNKSRAYFLETKDKDHWWDMIQLLPTSYNQKRTVMLNYEVLANIYKSRKNHKLDEWHVLCEWIESLPYSELITGKFEKSSIENNNKPEQPEFLKKHMNIPAKESIDVEKLMAEKEIYIEEGPNSFYKKRVASKTPLTLSEQRAIVGMLRDHGYMGNVEFKSLD